MSGLIEQLFGDYCFYRRQTANIRALKNKGARISDPELNAERAEVFGALVVFCKQHAVPPRQWLYYIFARRRWLYSPRCDRANLLCERALAGYRSWPDFSGFQKRIAATEAQREAIYLDHVYDPNRDLNHSVELLKGALVARGQVDRCLVGMHSQTFGYHPRSHICQRCMVRFVCAEQLRGAVNFDILALRRGEITSAQAQANALAGVNRYAR
jgi:hypothetical protein